MPVFEQTYARWTPERGTRLRWWPIVRRELALLVAQRAFRILLIVAALPTLVHLLQVYSVNKLAADPNSDLAKALRSVALQIDAEFFFQFLQVQTYFVFVLLTYASSGLVCDDIRLNLVEVYFSKPLTARDYLVGKVATVLGLGLAYTALPAIFLFGAQLMMAPGSGFWDRYAMVPLACLAFSAVVVVSIGMATLACSALTSSRGFAAASVITLLAADAFCATLLAEILGLRSVHIINVPAAMVRVGESLFGVQPYMPLGWPWALLVVGAVAALGTAVLHRRIRRVEVGA